MAATTGHSLTYDPSVNRIKALSRNHKHDCTTCIKIPR